jgi:hypothetical protein
MTLLSKTSGLAKTDVDRLADQTHTGQAHFAGTGPADAQCDGCFFFRPERVNKTDLFARPPSGRCAKHAELMRRQGPKFPGSARACRYYAVQS